MTLAHPVVRFIFPVVGFFLSPLVAGFIVSGTITIDSFFIFSSPFFFFIAAVAALVFYNVVFFCIEKFTPKIQAHFLTAFILGLLSGLVGCFVDILFLFAALG